MDKKTPLFLRTINLVKSIPKGKVLSYGNVANMVGAPGCARHVSFILSSSSKKYKLPWHRVISSSGKISEHRHTSKQLRWLEKEGVVIVRQTVDLIEYAWKPSKKEIQNFLKGLPRHQPKD